MSLDLRHHRFASTGAWARWLALAATTSALPACVESPNPPALAPPSGAPCAARQFPVYFATGSDQLSDPARQAIAAGAAGVKGCRIGEVDVFGLADLDGPAAQNLALSRRRASIVAQSLIAAGLPPPLFDVQGLGESGARTAHGRPALLQRKTEVVIRVAKPS